MRRGQRRIRKPAWWSRRCFSWPTRVFGSRSRVEATRIPTWRCARLTEKKFAKHRATTPRSSPPRHGPCRSSSGNRFSFAWWTGTKRVGATSCLMPSAPRENFFLTKRKSGTHSQNQRNRQRPQKGPQRSRRGNRVKRPAHPAPPPTPRKRNWPDSRSLKALSSNWSPLKNTASSIPSI